MAANTTTRVKIERVFHTLNVPLAANTALLRGNQVGGVPGSHTCAEIGSVANMTPLGMCKADQSEAAAPVEIELEQPMRVMYCDKDTVSPPVLTTDFLKPIYWKDDHTFSLTRADGSGGYRIRAGVLIDVNDRDGVGVWLQPLLANNGLAALIS